MENVTDKNQCYILIDEKITEHGDYFFDVVFRDKLSTAIVDYSYRGIETFYISDETVFQDKLFLMIKDILRIFRFQEINVIKTNPDSVSERCKYAIFYVHGKNLPIYNLIIAARKQSKTITVITPDLANRVETFNN